MPQTLHQIVRRSLLAAAGTLLAGAVAGKYLFDARAGAQNQAQAGPQPQPVTAVRAHPPVAAPPLHFTTADGATRSLSDYAGRVVVLNFWATWCVPCVSEMPALDALAGRAAGAGIAVLAVSLDHGGATAVQPFYAGHGIRNLPLLLDPHSDAMMALRLEGIPTTLVIDRAGREVARIEGPVLWDSPDAVALIGHLAG